jgi:hypothetical protein
MNTTATTMTMMNFSPKFSEAMRMWACGAFGGFSGMFASYNAFNTAFTWKYSDYSWHQHSQTDYHQQQKNK